MIYVAWAALYEGNTDKYYFDVLIPRLIESILLEYGVTKFVVPEFPAIYFSRGSNEMIARQICENDASFYLAFVHADTGGRAIERTLEIRGGGVPSLAAELCSFDPNRCVIVAPRHEMEAWALADASAVCSALGFRGAPSSIGLPTSPAAAERLTDPKATLNAAMLEVRGRRSSLPMDLFYPVIAQEQNFDVLNRCGSFNRFKSDLYAALKTLDEVR